MWIDTYALFTEGDPDSSLPVEVNWQRFAFDTDKLEAINEGDEEGLSTLRFPNADYTIRMPYDELRALLVKAGKLCYS